jgi:hypothetical protein
MFIYCVRCAFSGRGLSDELNTHSRIRTDCGASLCVITKPREREGHSPRWAAQPEGKNVLKTVNISEKFSSLKLLFSVTISDQPL